MIKLQDLRQTMKCTSQLLQSPQSFILKADKNILCGVSLHFNDWGSIFEDIMYHIISEERYEVAELICAQDLIVSDTRT